MPWLSYQLCGDCVNIPAKVALGYTDLKRIDSSVSGNLYIKLNLYGSQGNTWSYNSQTVWYKITNGSPSSFNNTRKICFDGRPEVKEHQPSSYHTYPDIIYHAQTPDNDGDININYESVGKQPYGFSYTASGTGTQNIKVVVQVNGLYDAYQSVNTTGYKNFTFLIPVPAVGSPTLKAVTTSSTYNSIALKTAVTNIGSNSKSITSRKYTIKQGSTTIVSNASWKDDTNITVNSLKPNTSYSYTITATNSSSLVGTKTGTITTKAISAPEAVTNLALAYTPSGTPTTISNYIASWTQPTNTGTNVGSLSYEVIIYAKRNGSFVNITNGSKINTTATQLQVNQNTTGILAGDTLKVQVIAYRTYSSTDYKSAKAEYTLSQTIEDDQASIMVKVAEQWKKGKVFVNANGVWTKAKAVYVKDQNNNWIKAE